ncbi:hypothetical protein GS891_26020 [Rhodococcus hoagii]|nr:hypothetical protein [Prescottella equi]
MDYTKFEPFFGDPLYLPVAAPSKKSFGPPFGRRDGSITEPAGRKYALDEALRQLCWHKHTGYESEEEIRIAVLNPPPGTRRTRKSAYGPRNVEYVELVAGDPMDPGATILAAGEPVPHLPIMAVRVDRGTLRPSWRRTSMPQHAFSTRTDTTFPCSRHRRPSSGSMTHLGLPGERPLNGGHSAAGERR